MPGILGTKLGMTQIIEENGTIVPMSLIECKPNKILQIKTLAKDGYSAVVLGYKPLKKPSKNKKFTFIKEFRISDEEMYKKDGEITLDILKEVAEVQITGTSKGKGFQGVVKRYHFAGGPASHGSHFKREPGSIGARAMPGRVHKGKRMAGRMGCEKVTIKKLPIVYRNNELNIIGVKGPVPGSNNNLIILKINES